MSTRAVLVGAALVWGVLAPVAAGCSDDDDPAAATMPAVELTALVEDGEASSSTLMADAIAGPAVINLWATWCGPCRTEMPAFQAVADEGGAARIIGINEGDDRDSATTFLEEVGVHFDQLIDPDGQIISELRIVGLPATIVLAADGTIVKVHEGPLDEAGIRELIDAAAA